MCAEVVRQGLAAFDEPAPQSGAHAAARGGLAAFLYLQLVEPHQPHTPTEDCCDASRRQTSD